MSKIFNCHFVPDSLASFHPDFLLRFILIFTSLRRVVPSILLIFNTCRDNSYLALLYIGRDKESLILSSSRMVLGIYKAIVFFLLLEIAVRQTIIYFLNCFSKYLTTDFLFQTMVLKIKRFLYQSHWSHGVARWNQSQKVVLYREWCHVASIIP